MVPLTDAQAMYNFKRTVFFRFRRNHRINRLPGDRVNLEDIVKAFEIERGRKSSNGVKNHAAITSTAAILEYHTKLMPMKKAAKVFKFSRTDFWRLRLKHRICRLSGSQVHTDDIIAALDAERNRLS